jgi:hypothetical protein
MDQGVNDPRAPLFDRDETAGQARGDGEADQQGMQERIVPPVKCRSYCMC